MIEFRCGAPLKFYRRRSRADLAGAHPLAGVPRDEGSSHQSSTAEPPLNATEPATPPAVAETSRTVIARAAFFCAGGARPDLGVALRRRSGFQFWT